MKKRLLLFMTCMLCSIGLVLAQNKRISGTVVDENGDPVIGATVLVKGTTVGVSTDADGKFFISVPSNGKVLKVSLIGSKSQEVPVGQNLKIVLKNDDETLDEVVVTALGIKKEAKALGYAVQEVKDIHKTGNPNLTTALQGKISGVDIKVSSGMPGASTQFNIRGARSFTGNNQPLFVIDGMPIESTPTYSTGSSPTASNGVTGTDYSNRSIDIDPNDIESINVLKGQAAAALYGIRASNGVVIITTKSGKGGAKGKTDISFSQNLSFDMVSRTPEYQTTYSQGTGGEYVYNSSMSWGEKISDLADNADYGGNTSNDYTESDGLQSGKYYVRQLAFAGEDPWVKPGVYDNWNDYFRTGVTSNTSLNISRAGENGHFCVGLGYTDQTGIALSSDMTRYNAKVSAEQKLDSNFSLAFSGNFSSVSINKLSTGNDGELAGVLSAPASYNLNGIPYHYAGDPYSQVYYRSLTFDNPYWAAENNTFNEETNRFFGNTHLDYNTKLNEKMKISAKYQIGVDSYTTNNTDIFGYGSGGGTGSINLYGTTVLTVNSLLTGVFDWKINNDFNFNMILGNEFNQENSNSYDESGTDFNFGGWNHLDNTTTQVSSSSSNKDRTVGCFYSASLDYKSMLFLNTTGRRDIVSSMPRNNRTFFYPSVSLGFVFTELASVKESAPWFTFGKVRASYAEVGQAGHYYENFYTTPSYSGSWWDDDPITYPLGGVSSYTHYGRKYASDLKPQNTKSYEFGGDFKLFDNRFGLNYTFSHQTVVDQIFPVPLAGSTGVSELYMNGGDMRTDVHEFTLFVVPVKTKDITWDASVNFTKTKNVVEKLADGVESIFLGGFTTPQVRAGIGYSFPVIYGTGYAKDSKGRILVDEDPTSSTYGMPYAGEDGVIGDISPKFIMGWSTNFTYKRVSLGATFEWKNGGEMYSGSNGLMDLYGVSKRTEDRTSTFVYKGYKADGTPNDIVRGGSDDTEAYQTLYSDDLGDIDEAYIYKNSFVKLRELSVKYTLPKKTLWGIDDISLSAYARNILLWTELPNMDPESSQGNTNMMGGFERFSLPQTKSFGFGLQVNF